MARRLAFGLMAAVLALAFRPAPAQALSTRTKAILYSLALPGAGHLYMGRTTRAQVFGAAELGVWAGFATFKIEGHTRKEDYIEMAEVLAGVADARGRSSEYYRNLGLYQSSDEYNEIEVQMYARYAFPDPDQRAAYIRDHLITGDATWDWTSEEWQTNYRLRRADSERSYRNAKYALAVGLLNRLVSAVDAARLSVRDGGAGADGAESSAPASQAKASQVPALTFGLTEGGVPYAALTATF